MKKYNDMGEGLSQFKLDWDIDESLNYDKIKITDNFLPDPIFNDVKELIIQGTDFKNGTNAVIQWAYMPVVVGKSVEDGTGNLYQFVHVLYNQHRPIPSESPAAKMILSPMLPFLNPISLMRIKINALPRQEKNIRSDFHTDMLPKYLSKQAEMHERSDMPKYEFPSDADFGKLGLCTTAIFYLTTTNGPTVFKDGTKCDSVANRLVEFPVNYLHASTCQTDTNIRVVMNFNYFK